MKNALIGVLVLFAAAGLGAAGCGGENHNPTDVCTTAPDGGLLYGGACTHNNDCASCICRYFEGDHVTQCTIACTSSSQCPIGSEGYKCNGEGYCKPP